MKWPCGNLLFYKLTEINFQCSDYTFVKMRHTDGQQMHEKVVNIIIICWRIAIKQPLGMAIMEKIDSQ